MSGETRILGSIIGAAFDSASDQAVTIDSTKYFITGYLHDNYPGVREQYLQVWTGPNRTGVKLQSEAFGVSTTPAAADAAAFRGSPPLGRISTEATLYISMSAPLQAAGLTGDIHVIGYDVP